MKVTINYKYPITAPFHSIDGWHSTPHSGVDFGFPMNTPVPSVGDGVVTFVDNHALSNLGNYVKVHMEDGTDAIYGHLNTASVHEGQIIHINDIIGLSGSTGRSSGAHLHLQMMKDGVPIDPMSHSIQNLPWWDLKGQAIEAFNAVGDLIQAKLIHLGYFLLDSLDIVLPTVALIGILWWMVPFFPKSDNLAPKITGSALLIFLFYKLIRST